MLRLGTDLSLKFQRRTLRVLLGPTQATPYPALLDSAFDRTQGALAGSNAITGAKAAILPGLVAVLENSETVTLAGAWASDGSAPHNRAFGLFANFVGGTLSDIPTDQAGVGVWRGVGSVYEILAPAFSTANSLSTIAAAGDGTGAKEVYMNSNAKGQLESAGAAVNAVNYTARIINYLSANAIVVELLV